MNQECLKFRITSNFSNMPPKKVVTVKTGAGSVPNIMVMLSKARPKEAAPSVVAAVPDTELASSDPLIQEYYGSLSPVERIAHTIAKEKLGTSYDVSRTHGFLRWQKTCGK
jgi:hypothetical protein